MDKVPQVLDKLHKILTRINLQYGSLVQKLILTLTLSIHYNSKQMNSLLKHKIMKYEMLKFCSMVSENQLLSLILCFLAYLF